MEEKTMDKPNNWRHSPKKGGCTILWRYVVVALCTLGMMNMYAMRSNLSVAMVCMVNQTALNILNGVNLTDNSTYQDVCGTGLGGEKTVRDGELVWDREIQGLVLSSFFWGYLVTQFPAGLLSTRIGGKRVVDISMAGSFLLAYLAPVCARYSHWALVANRIGQGLAQGMFFPGYYVVISSWAPPLERSRLAAYATSGIYWGSIVVSPVSALLCDQGSWEAIFYTFAATTTVWFMAWYFLVTDSPRTHRFISDEEREYITSSLDGLEVKTSLSQVPWKKMITSKVLWGVVVGHVGYNWGNYLLLTNLPTFFNEVFHLDIKSNGLFAALPYVAAVVLTWIFGNLADYLIRSGRLSARNTRRIMHFMGVFISSSLFLASSHVQCEVFLGIALIVLGQGFGGAVMSSFMCSFVDIAPRYSDLVMGISNTFATIPGIVAPALVGYLTPGQSAEEWQLVFYIGFGFQTLTMLVYVWLVQAEVQPWAADHPAADSGREKGAKEMEAFGQKNETFVNDYAAYACQDIKF